MTESPEPSRQAEPIASAREWTLAAGFGLLVLALLLPWPRPSVSLRSVCELQESGRFAAQCDLAAAAQRSGRSFLRTGIRVYEGGILLRQADRAADVKRENPGSYHTNGQLLTVSALDRSDPRSNGLAYVVRPAEHDPLGLGEGRRRPLALAGVAAAFGAVAFALRRRAAPLVRATLLSVACAGIVVQLLVVLAAAPVHVDTGETLASAEAIARGAVPYRSLAYDLYTPLGAYELALWGVLWPGPGPVPYPWYIGLILLNEIVCATVVFALLRRGGVSRDLALLSALGAFSMTLWFDGGRILHEPMYLVPVLLAAGLLTRADTAASRFGAGVLAAVAFMVKQYGGLGLAGLGLAALFAERRRVRSILLVMAGFLAGLAACLALLLLAGADVRTLVPQVLGPGYPRRFESVWLERFLWQCPLALIAPFAVLIPGVWSRPVARVASAFLIASCLPFLIRQHQYYFLIPAPWLFVLFALGIDALSSRSGWIRPAARAVAAVLLLSIPMRAAVAQAQLFKREWRGDQFRQARLMNLAWPQEKPTLVLANPGFYYLTHYVSADEASLGYMFLNGQTAAKLRAGFRKAKGVWIDPNGMYARGVDRILTEAGSSLADELAANAFEKRLVLEERFELWTK